ncbi:hypothetical protein BT69DRAFT_1280414 [Atractiella rhizophila]|nr:hypothetical protein BT69DRAFT_1280414 [Atractiella rhizophila]
MLIGWSKAQALQDRARLKRATAVPRKKIPKVTGTIGAKGFNLQKVLGVDDKEYRKFRSAVRIHTMAQNLPLRTVVWNQLDQGKLRAAQEAVWR